MERKKQGKRHSTANNKSKNVDRKALAGITYGKTKSQKKREKNAVKYKQFIGNKQEGQGFADKRKTKFVYEYKKLRAKERRQQTANKALYLEDDDNQGHDQSRKKKKEMKMSKFFKAQLEAKQRQEEQQTQQEEQAAAWKAKEEALQKYSKSKKQKHKKLAVKNYKGQPNMASQMDLLLKKIEKQVKS